MYYLYNSLVPLNMSVEPGPKFQALAPLFNVFGSFQKKFSENFLTEDGLRIIRNVSK